MAGQETTPAESRDYAGLDFQLMFQPDSEFNWEQLLAMDRVAKVEIAVGKLACLCGNDVRMHHFATDFAEPSTIWASARRICTGQIVVPLAYSTSIQSKQTSTARKPELAPLTLF